MLIFFQNSVNEIAPSPSVACTSCTEFYIDLGRISHIVDLLRLTTLLVLALLGLMANHLTHWRLI